MTAEEGPARQTDGGFDESGDGAPVPWRALRDDALVRLERAGVPAPAVDAGRMVETCLGIDATAARAALDEPATVLGAARFERMVTRRSTGEPLQYVLGSWGFRSLDLHLDDRVLIPRPETETVAGLAIAEANQRAAADGREVAVADLGTGSGAMALAIAVECSQAIVTATDVDEAALAVARANLAGVGRAATRVELRHGSWFEALPERLWGELDVVVSNPPYVADAEDLPAVVADWEPVHALRAGPRGTEHVELLIDGAGGWLRGDGVLVLEMAPHQTEAMARRAEQRGFRARIEPDLAGRPRAVVARR